MQPRFPTHPRQGVLDALGTSVAFGATEAPNSTDVPSATEAPNGKGPEFLFCPKCWLFELSIISLDKDLNVQLVRVRQNVFALL